MKLGLEISVPDGQQDAFWRDFRAAQKRGIGWRHVNEEFGHTSTSSWAYQMAHGEIDATLNALKQWIALTGGRSLVAYLADLANLTVVDRSNVPPELAVARAGREANEACAVAFEALEDGRVSAVERDACLREIDEATGALARLRRAIDEKAKQDWLGSGRAATLREAG